MRYVIKTIVCMGGVLCSISTQQSNKWHGIEPLHSTRVEVERITGPAMQPNGITYDLKNKRVTVLYSDGGCAEGRPSEWNVPRDTVIAITIYPQTKLMVSDLRIDLSSFEKFINPRDKDSVSYNNREQGIGVGTRSNGEVTVIQYFPALKDQELRCQNSSRNELSKDEIEFYKFDEYGNLSFSDEKTRLVNFATYLQKERDFKGYIVIYDSPRTSLAKARLRARQARNHLVKVLGIDARRVISLVGGCREKLEIELYAIPSTIQRPATGSPCPK
jgi:hypothetical protein